jgi:hypothetical protein
MRNQKAKGKGQKAKVKAGTFVDSAFGSLLHFCLLLFALCLLI